MLSQVWKNLLNRSATRRYFRHWTRTRYTGRLRLNKRPAISRNSHPILVCIYFCTYPLDLRTPGHIAGGNGQYNSHRALKSSPVLARRRNYFLQDRSERFKTRRRRPIYIAKGGSVPPAGKIRVVLRPGGLYGPCNLTGKLAVSSNTFETVKNFNYLSPTTDVCKTVKN